MYADIIGHMFFFACVHSHTSLLTAVFAFFFVLGFQNTTSLIVRRFMQIPISCLTEFLSALERGYCKHNNPYHSHVHAADVTQTLHCLLLRSGLVVNHFVTPI